MQKKFKISKKENLKKKLFIQEAFHLFQLAKTKVGKFRQLFRFFKRI